MKNYWIITCALLIMGMECYSQQFIHPGETKRITAEEDTLYVISIHQMRQAVKAAEELEV
jgi:hypothetical protein